MLIFISFILNLSYIFPTNIIWKYSISTLKFSSMLTIRINFHYALIILMLTKFFPYILISNFTNLFSKYNWDQPYHGTNLYLLSLNFFFLLRFTNKYSSTPRMKSRRWVGMFQNRVCDCYANKTFNLLGILRI